MPAHLRNIASLGAIVLAIAAVAASVAPVHGATSGTVVGAVVPSATEVDVSGCLPGVAGTTSFGSVLPGSPAVTTASCAVSFGSSNGASSLRVAQPDGATDAMYRPTTGSPDLSFGGDGYADTPDANWSNTLTGAFAQDGSVYLGGRANGYNAIAHIGANGVKDAAFGTTGGHARIDYAGAGFSQLQARDLFVLTDGSFLYVGAAMFAGTERVFVAKFSATGQPDLSFGGGDGLVEVPGSGNVPGIPNHGLLLPDGGVLLAGINGVVGWAVTARITSSGQLDPAWGDGGTRVVATSTMFDSTYGDAVRDRLGRIVLTGDAGPQMAAARMTADGRLDTTFGAGGVATVTFPGSTGGEGYAIGVQPSGRIVMAGDAYYGSVQHAAAALTTTGAPDATWGSGGTFHRDIGPYDDQGYGSAVSPDGRVYIAGLVVQDAWNTGDLTVLDREGQLDQTFSGDGLLPLPNGDGDDNMEVMDVFVSDYGVGVVGWGDYFMWKFAHARVPDYDDADFDWNDGSGMFGVCLLSAGTATNAWPTTGACPASDGTNWRAVPRHTLMAGAVAATRASAGTSTVALRFGVRMPGNQPAGQYTAPIAFEVTAP